MEDQQPTDQIVELEESFGPTRLRSREVHVRADFKRAAECFIETSGSDGEHDSDRADSGALAIRRPTAEYPPRDTAVVEIEENFGAVRFSKTEISKALTHVDEQQVCPPYEADSPADYLLSRTYPVWFGTDRNWALDPSGRPQFASGWSKELAFGCCKVHVPKTHAFGSIGSSWIVRKFKTKILRLEDDLLTLREINLLPGAEAFQDSVQDELAKWPKRTALVLVHGYNVCFEDAAIRAAQIGFDLRVDGITAFFSWPSQGNLVPYEGDEARVELSENHFIEFLVRLSEVPNIEEINVLAHSMGNRLLFRAVPRLLELHRTGSLAVPIGHLVLAAADLTTEFFQQYADLYPRLAARRVTNYTHEADNALRLSRALHQIGRVGLEPPIFVHQGIDTVSASSLDLDLLGHGYFAAAAPLLYDINELIHDHKPPAQRVRIQPAQAASGKYWVIGK